MSSICFLTASRLKEAGSCIGGYSMAVLARAATCGCTRMKRQRCCQIARQGTSGEERHHLDSRVAKHCVPPIEQEELAIIHEAMGKPVICLSPACLSQVAPQLRQVRPPSGTSNLGGRLRLQTGRDVASP